MLLELEVAKLLSTSKIAAASAADVQAAIDKVPCEFVVEQCGAEIHAIATELVKDEYRNVLIPQTMDELLTICHIIAVLYPGLISDIVRD